MNTRFSFVRTSSLAALLALAVSVPVARAQHPRSLAKATVPFAFQYGGRAFPAGKYTFGMLSDNILQIHGTNSAALGVVEWADDNRVAQAGKLIFRRVGDRYVLRDLWVPALSAHLLCPQPKEQKRREVVEANSAPANVEVALLESSR